MFVKAIKIHKIMNNVIIVNKTKIFNHTKYIKHPFMYNYNLICFVIMNCWCY